MIAKLRMSDLVVVAKALLWSHEAVFSSFHVPQRALSMTFFAVSPGAAAFFY
jgi:hypothetical protein